MSVLAHLDSLYKKHETLKKEVAVAYSHHAPDDRLKELKKMKLRLKDEIEGLSRKAGNENNPDS